MLLKIILSTHGVALNVINLTLRSYLSTIVFVDRRKIQKTIDILYLMLVVELVVRKGENFVLILVRCNVILVHVQNVT